MIQALIEEEGSCVEAWPSSRLVSALMVLVLLPPVRPGPTIDEISAALREADVRATSKRAIYRLIADLREAGFDIRSDRLPNGKIGYYLSGVGPILMQRMGL